MPELHRSLALVPYPPGRAPGQRYRIEQWAPYLRAEGIELVLAPFSSEALADALYQPGHWGLKAWLMVRAWLAALKGVRRAAEFDSVFLYREAALLGPALIERLAQKLNPRLVYDFDDAIWLRYVSPRNRYLSYLKTPGKTRTLCRMSAAVTVGNEYLAEFARRYNHDVTVIPSTVSLRDYRPAAPQNRDEVPVVGWTGSHSSVQYLRVVEGALRTLARIRPFRLRVIGVEDLRIAGVDVECRSWNPATEVEDLWPMTVGIMPLVDDPWAAGKCAMKAIQYLAIGIPAVVSPIGANRDVVQDGVTGFHANNEADWVRALQTCLDDEVLRSRMGKAGRKVVEARYSAESQAPRLAAVIQGLSSGSRKVSDASDMVGGR